MALIFASVVLPPVWLNESAGAASGRKFSKQEVQGFVQEENNREFIQNGRGSRSRQV